MTQLLIQGSTILAQGPFTGIEDDSDSIQSSDAIYPKHVIEGWQIVECDVPDEFTPAGYTWNGLEVAAKRSVFVPPTIKEYTDAVQNYLDAAARAKNYDDIVSACSYAGAPNPFQSEGQAFLTWRGNVWATCYRILADVQAGNRQPPSIDALIVELPALQL